MARITGILIGVLIYCTIHTHCVSDEIKAVMTMLHNTCIEKSGAKEEMITNANNGIFADDQSFKCYIKCIMFETATMDEDGVVDVETTISMMPDELQADPGVTSSVRKCGTQVGADLCETAWLTHKCWYTSMPDKYYIF